MPAMITARPAPRGRRPRLPVVCAAIRALGTMGRPRMLRRLLLWASENAWLRSRLPRLGFVRRAVSRFMPGEDAEAALAATAALNRRGLGTVLTLLGENVKDTAEFDGVVRHYAGVIEAIEKRKLDAEISVKLTHL